MFDVGWQELFVVAVLAIIVVGPKDMPRAIRTVTSWIRKAKSMARDFQNGMDNIVREAELEDIRKEAEKAAGFNIEDEIRKTIDPTGDMTKELEDLSKMTDEGEEAAEEGDTWPAAVEEETGQTAAKEETGQTAAKEETGQTAAKEETGQTAAKEETGQTAVKEETGPTVAKEETGQTVAKEETGQTAAEEETGQTVAENTETEDALGEAEKENSDDTGNDAAEAGKKVSE